MLLGVEYGLGRVRRLDHVVLGALDPVGVLALVQDELAATPAPVALRQESIISTDTQENQITVDTLPSFILEFKVF